MIKLASNMLSLQTDRPKHKCYSPGIEGLVRDPNDGNVIRTLDASFHKTHVTGNGPRDTSKPILKVNTRHLIERMDNQKH